MILFLRLRVDSELRRTAQVGRHLWVEAKWVVSNIYILVFVSDFLI